MVRVVEQQAVPVELPPPTYAIEGLNYEQVVMLRCIVGWIIPREAVSLFNNISVDDVQTLYRALNAATTSSVGAPSHRVKQLFQ